MRFDKSTISAPQVRSLWGKFKERQLHPGDILLFDSPGIFSKLIKFKTGGKYSHAEVYVGNNTVWASRNGQGVNSYPLDLTHVVAILRPRGVLEWQPGIRWFHSTAKGQKYDWLGLLNFYFAKWQGKENHRMFCSEFVVRVFRAFNYPLFPNTVDADAVHPSALPLSTQVDLLTEL